MSEVYAPGVAKRTNINLDMELVQQAAQARGTRRTIDTVHEALRDVHARSRRTRLAQRNFEDVTPESLEAMRRPRGRSAKTELADTSAWIWSRRRAHPQLRAVFDTALVDGQLATCDMAPRAAQQRPQRARVKHPDLLIAAAAEAAGIALAHYDEDYDRIAEITGQPTRWLAPAGTLR